LRRALDCALATISAMPTPGRARAPRRRGLSKPEIIRCLMRYVARELYNALPTSIAEYRSQKSKRFKSVVHPSPKVWMHHVEIRIPIKSTRRSRGGCATPTTPHPDQPRLIPLRARGALLT
jgi:hypothetical protein